MKKAADMFTIDNQLIEVPFQVNFSIKAITEFAGPIEEIAQKMEMLDNAKGWYLILDLHWTNDISWSEQIVDLNPELPSDNEDSDDDEDGEEEPQP